MTTDWTSLLSTKRNITAVTEFAHGKTSWRQFYAAFANTSSGGIVRSLLRNYGVTKDRTLDRKALSRRASSTSV